MSNATDRSSAFPPDEDEITLVEAANAVLRNWRIVVGLPVLLAVLVGVWTLVKERMYVATASFMSQAPEGRGPAGAAALAQQFGVSLGTDRPGQTPEFYVDLLQSRTLLRQTVESEYQLPTEGGGAWAGTLVQYWEFDDRGGRLPPWRRATEKLAEAISTSVSRETGVVEVTVAVAHPVLAEQIAARLIELLTEFNLDVRQSRAREESRFIRDRMTEAQAELLVAEVALQGFLRQNRQFRSSPELTFEHDRMQREVMMRQEILASLLRSQEQARFDAVRDTPIFAVIDHPEGTAEPKGRRTVALALFALTLGLIVAVTGAFAAEFARRSWVREDPHYREFQGLARQAWAEFRHPGKWLGRRARPAPANTPDGVQPEPAATLRAAHGEPK